MDEQWRFKARCCPLAALPALCPFSFRTPPSARLRSRGLQEVEEAHEAVGVERRQQAPKHEAGERVGLQAAAAVGRLLAPPLRVVVMFLYRFVSEGFC